MENITEIKMKIVLIDLWKRRKSRRAEEIIDEFEKEINEIDRGN